MASPHDHPTVLKDLQDSIYREKVLRARAMTPEERLDEGFRLTDAHFQNLFSAALTRLGTTDVSAGWAEVTRELEAARRVEEKGFFVSELPPEIRAARGK